jgi:hypothetical protein
VFKGRVDVSAKGQTLAAGAPARGSLVADQGVRVEDDGEEVIFIQDLGECFIQTIDQAGRDEHVLAWWRFEDRPIGAVLPHTAWNKKPVRATCDSSFNGNDLFVWSPDSRPVFSGVVAAASVPQTGVANRSCLDLTDPLRANKTRPEVYTNSRLSHAAPRDIQQIKPAHWTVEASVKLKSLDSDRQTIVCRDGCVGQSARFALSVMRNLGLAANYVDVGGRFHAVRGNCPVEADHWYHLAVTSDGRVLELYADACDGRGYRLVGSQRLPASGSTALGSCGDDCSWAVGRSRLKKGNVGDGLLGWIDEVRICDEALQPGEFLFADPRGWREER